MPVQKETLPLFADSRAKLPEPFWDGHPSEVAWSEWEYWRHYADRKRLERVFPVVLAYHQWLSRWHSWPDGSLWSTGWGCGMDNQPRVEGDPRWDHGRMAWSDATLQQCLSA